MTNQYLYQVQYLLDRALTTPEIVGIRDQHGSLIATNVTDHPFPDETIIEEFAAPHGYVAAIASGHEPAEALKPVADAVRAVIGEGHLVGSRARAVTRFDPTAVDDIDTATP